MVVITKQNHVEISISDNGIGINEVRLKTLFNISSNTSSLGTASEKGSGLGLVLCKEFVAKLGGSIRVESKEGIGSNFKFTLPLNKSEWKRMSNYLSLEKIIPNYLRKLL